MCKSPPLPETHIRASPTEFPYVGRFPGKAAVREGASSAGCDECPPIWLPTAQDFLQPLEQLHRCPCFSGHVSTYSLGLGKTRPRFTGRRWLLNHQFMAGGNRKAKPHWCNGKKRSSYHNTEFPCILSSSLAVSSVSQGHGLGQWLFLARKAEVAPS